eukprot:scaffold21436_cov146-Isochrysis_galbana.AAC.2
MQGRPPFTLPSLTGELLQDGPPDISKKDNCTCTWEVCGVARGPVVTGGPRQWRPTTAYRAEAEADTDRHKRAGPMQYADLIRGLERARVAAARVASRVAAARAAAVRVAVARAAAVRVAARAA